MVYRHTYKPNNNNNKKPKPDKQYIYIKKKKPFKNMQTFTTEGVHS